MAVDLKYYRLEESSGLLIPVDGALSFGAMFRGNQEKVGLKVKNDGDSPAVFVTAQIGEYTMDDNKEYPDSYKWKKLSLSKTMGFETKVNLPDILPNSWMTGRDIFTEDFSKYPPDIGAQPDIDWKLWGGNEKTWEIYSGYLQHNTDTQNGRALWDALPSSADYDFSCKITVRDGVWAGIIVRDEGDFNTGYIVLIQGQDKYYPRGMDKAEGVIQVWNGKFTEGIDSWTLLWQSNTIGIRSTHDGFKMRIKGNRFDFWYRDLDSQTPLYSFIDEESLHIKSSKPILACHAGNGSTLIYYDDIRMEVETEQGVLWIENNVSSQTDSFGINKSILDVRYGGN